MQRVSRTSESWFIQTAHDVALIYHIDLNLSIRIAHDVVRHTTQKLRPCYRTTSSVNFDVARSSLSYDVVRHRTASH
jgi:hypothetical protein